MKRYIRRIGTLISQFVNTVFLLGNPDESISARSYRRGVLESSKWWFRAMTVINILVWPLEKDHCHQAHLMDIHHAQELLHVLNKKENK